MRVKFDYYFSRVFLSGGISSWFRFDPEISQFAKDFLKKVGL
jgi:hypothetical protein